MLMSKCKFRTQFDRVVLISEPGSPEVIDYIGEYDINGEIVLKETGKHSLYDEIQSHRDSCDLNLIVKRFLNGDESALSRRQAMYGDFTTMPKTYMEMLNATIKAEQLFKELPVDVQQQFDNNFALWLNEVNSPDWARKMGFTPKPSQVAPQTAQPAEKGEIKE